MKHRILTLLLLIFAAIAYAQPSVNTGNDVFICFGQSVQLAANVTGGTPPYNYQWSPASSLSQPAVHNPLASPTITTYYSVIVTDNNNLTATDTIIVTVFDKPEASYNITPISCFGANDGIITLTVTNGNTPYAYTWSNGITTQNAINLPAGTYSVIVTDINGCTDSASAIIIEPTAVSLTFNNIVDATCGASNGGACMVPSGGTVPYSYTWNVLQITNCMSNVPAGMYIATVTDANGCTASDNVTIGTVNTPIIITTDSVIDAACHGGSSGSIYINVSGGTAPYNYMWNNSSNMEDQMNLNVGTYILTVTDNAGCLELDTFVIGEPTPLAVNPSVTNVTCHGGTDGSIAPNVSGGVAPYLYLWSVGATNEVQVNLPAGTYTVTVIDANGCSITASANVAEPATQLTVSLTSTTNGTLPDTLVLSASGGTTPYTYIWSTGETGAMSQIEVTNAGLYAVTVMDMNMCTASATIMVGCPDTCVWPGDADYSGLADNNDLLAIGLAYGATGTARADQSINWYVHQSANWANYLDTITNYKHIDCNGDGTVNSDDTLAIIQNYGYTHPRSGPDEVRGGIPSLRVRMVPDTLEDGQTVVAHLELGDANSAVSDVYALAFTFNFDALVVDTDEVYIVFDNNSWLCNNTTDHIDISKKYASAGKLHAAVTRIDHTNRSGGGEIGKVSMKITTGNINGKDLANYVMNCYITDLRVIDNQGNEQQIDAIGDAANVQYTPTSINEVNWKGEVALYPNPAKQQLTISSTQMPITSLQVNNLLGEVMIQQQDLHANKTVIDIATLANGVYVLKLSSDNRTYHTKFLVVK